MLEAQAWVQPASFHPAGSVEAEGTSEPEDAWLSGLVLCSNILYTWTGLLIGGFKGLQASGLLNIYIYFFNNGVYCGKEAINAILVNPQCGA